MTPRQLKKWREELELTQLEFAELVGYKVWTISNWEQNGGIPVWMDLIKKTVTNAKIRRIAHGSANSPTRSGRSKRK